MSPEEYYKKEVEEVCKNIFLKKLTISENEELKRMANYALKSVFPSCFLPPEQNIYESLNNSDNVDVLYEKSRFTINSEIPVIEHIFFINGDSFHIRDTFIYYPEIADGRRNPSDDSIILFNCQYIADYSEKLEESFIELKNDVARKIKEHQKLREDVKQVISLVDIPQLDAEYNELLTRLKQNYANYSEERIKFDADLYYSKEQSSIFPNEENHHSPVKSFYDLWENAHERFDKSNSDKYKEWKKIW